MRVHAVFQISNHGADLWLVRGRRPARHLVHLTDPETAAEPLQELARPLATLPVSVYVDLVEEDFRLRSVPKVRGRDHQALVERHLRREFRDTDYRLLCSRFPDPANRGRETLVLAGIILPEQVDRWVRPLQAAGCRLEGIASATLLMPRVLAALPREWRHRSCLVALCNRHGGVRLTLFHQGRLRFSRISHHDASEQDFMTFLTGELLRSRRFYENLRLLERGAEVHCVCLAGKEAGLEDREIDTGLHLHVHSTLRFGLPPLVRHIDGRQGDGLLAELLVRRPPRSVYTNPEMRGVHRIERVRRAAWAVGLASVAASTAYAGITWVDLQRLDAKERELATRREELRGQLATLEATGTRSERPASFMKAAVSLASRVQPEAQTAIVSHLAALGRLLERYPEFRLTKLAWHRDPPLAANADHAKEDYGELARLGANEVLERITAAPLAIVLQGTLPLEPLRLPELRERLIQLERALARLPGVTGVEWLENPFDPEHSSGGLRGRLGTGTSADRATVSLLLRMKAS